MIFSENFLSAENFPERNWAFTYLGAIDGDKHAIFTRMYFNIYRFSFIFCIYNCYEINIKNKNY